MTLALGCVLSVMKSRERIGKARKRYVGKRWLEAAQRPLDVSHFGIDELPEIVEVDTEVLVDDFIPKRGQTRPGYLRMRSAECGPHSAGGIAEPQDLVRHGLMRPEFLEEGGPAPAYEAPDSLDCLAYVGHAQRIVSHSGTASASTRGRTIQ
jgi:hypothetical protein